MPLKTRLRVILETLRARLCRWWYLLLNGMWEGECAVDYFDHFADGSKHLRLLGSGRPALGETDVYVNYKIWWDRSKSVT